MKSSFEINARDHLRDSEYEIMASSDWKRMADDIVYLSYEKVYLNSVEEIRATKKDFLKSFKPHHVGLTAMSDKSLFELTL